MAVSTVGGKLRNRGHVLAQAKFGWTLSLSLALGNILGSSVSWCKVLRLNGNKRAN